MHFLVRNWLLCVFQSHVTAVLLSATITFNFYLKWPFFLRLLQLRMVPSKFNLLRNTGIRISIEIEMPLT